MKKAQTNGTMINARWEAPYCLLTADILAMAVGVEPSDIPPKPAETTAASKLRPIAGNTTNRLTATDTTTCAARIAIIGPARSIKVQSCMLIKDMARKVPSDRSAIRATAGFRFGHDVPVKRGNFFKQG